MIVVIIINTNTIHFLDLILIANLKKILNKKGRKFFDKRCLKRNVGFFI